jgi:hypothetical protein
MLIKNIQGDRLSNFYYRADVFEKYNSLNEELKDGKKMKLFSSINCFDFSKFCTRNLSVYDFPSFHFYKYGRLVKKFSYLPDDESLFNHINLCVN